MLMTEQSDGRDDGTILGGCLCGAVRYAFRDPVFMGNCYCRDCQRSTGAAYAPVIAVLEEKLRLSGDLRWNENRSDAGNIVNRGFCYKCGTALIGRLEKNPYARAILAGTLDDTSRFLPGFNMWVSRAPVWAHPDNQLPSFAGQPPETDAMYDAIRR
jgi:hypothetical protein